MPNWLMWSTRTLTFSGIGIDDDAALLVRQDAFEVIGIGRVAIYDNVRHGGSWYYWLKPGERFDLSKWTKIER